MTDWSGSYGGANPGGQVPGGGNPPGGWPQPGTPAGPPPQSGYGAPASGYGQSASGYGQPASGYGQPASGYGNPAASAYSGITAGNGYGSTPTPGRNRKPLIITIVAGVAVLIVVGIVLAMTLTGGNSPDNASTPGEAVKGYLEALARGDAETALAYSDDQPASKDFLSADILKKQIDKWPISNIRILNDDSSNSSIGMGEVHVAATFGDKTSDATMRVKKANGKWRLEQSSVKLEAGYGGSRDAAAKTITVFGKSMGDGPIYVFPGFLDIGSSNAYLTVTAKPILLDAMHSYSSARLELTYDMSDKANKEVMAAVTNAFATCTQSHSMNGTAPCPDVYGLAEGSVNWGPADLSGVKISFSQYDLSARVSGNIPMVATGQDKYNGGSVQKSANAYLNATADLSKTPLTVSYR